MKRKSIASLRTYASLAAEQRKKSERERVLLWVWVLITFGYFGAHIIAAIIW
jgi:hypothetical protein